MSGCIAAKVNKSHVFVRIVSAPRFLLLRAAPSRSATRLTRVSRCAPARRKGNTWLHRAAAALGSVAAGAAPLLDPLIEALYETQQFEAIRAMMFRPFLCVGVYATLQRIRSALRDDDLNARQQYPLQPLRKAQGVATKRLNARERRHRGRVAVPQMQAAELGLQRQQRFADLAGTVIHSNLLALRPAVMRTRSALELGEGRRHGGGRRRRRGTRHFGGASDGGESGHCRCGVTGFAAHAERNAFT